jgi:hypothetical protein
MAFTRPTFEHEIHLQLRNCNMRRVDLGLGHPKVPFPAVNDEILPPLLVFFSKVDLASVGNEKPSDESANKTHRAADDECVSHA